MSLGEFTGVSSAKRASPRVAMVSTHGYVAAAPPLGAADTGGQVVYVIELSKKLAALGYEVDIWTRQFATQPATDDVCQGVRVLRVPCGGAGFIPKEYLCESLGEWSDNALRRMREEGLHYEFVNSHYWDAGVAAHALCTALPAFHVHTPHSLGFWKERQMQTDYPEGAAHFERTYNFSQRMRTERQIYHDADLVIATTPDQVDLLSSHYEVPETKLRMIPPGYDDSRFYPVGSATRRMLRRKFGFEGRVILSLGRISPFGFSWRCDVWGNILAFLFNIIDVNRARIAFEFMWGVGVNRPFPVHNLYPPVLTGDPEWRPYFTVNLLNLPGHYHNGGIWPHIGGMWVRFIHRLGMRELACRELVRLAELNRSGIRSEWEFNEWAHAGTGRPMGKRFQAWAAASYLRACRELELVVDETEHD